MKFKVGDKVRIIANNHNHKFKIGDIVEIIAIYTNDYLAKFNDDKWYVEDDELELVEEEKTLGDTLKDFADTILTGIKENPDFALQCLSKNNKIKDAEIEALKIENENLKSKVDYLRGQISVYEKYFE